MLPSRENYSPDPKGLLQWVKRGSSFGDETESLYKTKFSSRASPYLTQLGNIGIALPFGLQNAESTPERLGKWFGVVGDWLVRGEIDEARTVGNDEHLWFR